MQVHIPPFATARVLVVGDAMIDRYWHGDTSRISPEAPVPVVNVADIEERPGGAANVAVNVAALGAQVSLMSLVGDDVEAKDLEQACRSRGVKCEFVQVPGIHTTTKLRIMSRHQQLIRLDFETDLSTPSHDINLLPLFEELLLDVDVVIFSDYGKGTLQDIQSLIKVARAKGKKTLIDPKLHDAAPYTGASLMTPNLSEFEQMVGKSATQDELVARGIAFIRQYKIDELLVTLGDAGMMLISEDNPGVHIPALAKEVYDVTGAGDTVIAVLGACLASEQQVVEAMIIANAAASVVVSKTGTATVTTLELEETLRTEHEHGQSIVSENELLMLVAGAKARGERIVMTNGCFDILHLGHVKYLEEARSHGDRLIIAVNTDESVARLKGPQRPVNAVSHRMGVLSALSSVDWVVPFSEDTPARLIARVLPDVLVKAGDYQPDEIAGSDTVIAHGGTVEIMNFFEGYSTTSTIEKIQQVTESEEADVTS